MSVGISGFINEESKSNKIQRHVPSPTASKVAEPGREPQTATCPQVSLLWLCLVEPQLPDTKVLGGGAELSCFSALISAAWNWHIQGIWFSKWIWVVSCLVQQKGHGVWAQADLGFRPCSDTV